MDKNKKRFYVTLIIGIIILIIMLQHISLKTFISSVQEANFNWIMIAVICIVSSYVLRAFRWKTLLTPFKKGLSYKNIFSLTVLSYYVNLIAPMRFGELARLFLLKKKEGIPITKSSSTIVLISLLDAMSALLIGFLIILLFPSSTPLISSHLWYGILILGLITLLIISLMLRGRYFINILRKVINVIPIIKTKTKERINNIIQLFVDSFFELKKSKIMLPSFFFALLIQIALITAYYSVLRSLGNDLSIAAVAFGNMIIVLTLIIPTTPGRIGSFEVVWLLAFAATNIAATEIITASIVAHFLLTITVIILGNFAFYSLKIHNLDSLTQQIKRESHEKALSDEKIN